MDTAHQHNRQHQHQQSHRQQQHHQHHHMAIDPARPATIPPGSTVVDLEARETDWEIAPERTIRGYGLNGQIPGPVIEAERGIPLAIRLANHLPEPTIIHWHGLRIPSAMDGTDDVQLPVQPGETFTYVFTPPDAGTFWYHSHLNETEQLEKGIYGALIVRGGETDELRLDGEQILVVDDVKLDKEGRLARFGGFMQRHDGREGDIRLVNGKQEPSLSIAAGQIERWRIIIAASARYIRLSIGGAPFRIIGTDGGLIESPVTATEVLLAPADRVDLAVGPFTEGEVLAVEALPYYRGTFGRRKTERFATLRVGPEQPSSSVIPERLRTIEPLVTESVTATRTVKMSGRLSLKRGVDFLINDEKHHHAEPVKVGELQVWDIVNVSPIDHPFHLHGFFFQVLSINGEAPAWRSWEDVVNVPPRSTVRIAWMPDDRPGRWMYHCHILEHHAQGMMAHFDLVR